MADRVNVADFSASDWRRLREMRERFLAAENGEPIGSYWRTRRDLELYDATFARRIAWKWEAVLDELAHRGRLPTATRVLDFACGTGIAGQRYEKRCQTRFFGVWDVSSEAREFARERLLAEHPRLEVVTTPPGATAWPELVLVSHVLDELAPDALAQLLQLIRQAQAVIWVEPGSRASARKLVEIRETLRGELAVLAPCTHAAACGMRSVPLGWCHHFTRPPPEVHTSSFWRRFADELGLDLRSVPYSFLALARDAAAADGTQARILGRPRVTKGRALLDACDATGVHELALLERTDKRLFKSLERGTHEPLLSELAHDGQRISAIRALPAP